MADPRWRRSRRRRGRSSRGQSDPGAQGADLGLRQDRGRRFRARAEPRSGIEILSTGGTASAIRDAGLEVTDVVRVHRPGGDPRRAGEDAAPAAPRGACSRGGTTRSTWRRSGRGDRTDRPRVREPLSVSADGRRRRRDRGRGGREHRHRRPDDDPRGGEEPSVVAVVVRPESYDAVLAELEGERRRVSEETRHWLANEAFADIAGYDAAITRWFGLRYEAFPQWWVFAYEKFLDLSYGENPHQTGALYVGDGRAVARARAGVEAARPGALVQQRARPRLGAQAAGRVRGAGGVIVKHNNPCGAAIAGDVGAAYEKALACDPLSAFGGVIALNRPVDRELAERLHEQLRRGAGRARLRRGRARGAEAARRRSASSTTPSARPPSRASAT